jgi:hypothetical protein
MYGSEARVLLGRSHDARGRHFTIDEAGTEPGLKCRMRLESDSPQARSLEGRQLAMYFSLMFPDRSRLRLSEPAATTSAASRRDDVPPLLAREGDRGTRAPATRELEKWKNSQL